jgi:hypothetical protein
MFSILDLPGVRVLLRDSPPGRVDSLQY